MVSDGPMQDGDAAYHASGPRPVAVLDERTLSTLGVAEGEPVTPVDRARLGDAAGRGRRRRRGRRLGARQQWRCAPRPRPRRTLRRPGHGPTGPDTRRCAARRTPPGRTVTVVATTPLTAGGLVSRADDLSAFGQDAVWVVLLKALLIFVVLVLLTLFNIWWERRVVARMQHRIGPNMHGPFGLLQSLADGVKLALKEDITPKAADKIVFIIAPVHLGGAGLRGLLGHPVRPRGDDPVHRHRHAAAADRHAGGGAVRAGDRLDRHLRHRARRLVVGLDVLPARRAAQLGADDLLRGRDGPRLRRGLPLRRLDVDLGDRRGPGGHLVRLLPAALVRDLRDRDGGGDQPRALRPPRGRGRAGRRLPHRVQLAEVRAVLPRRVHQHGDGLGPRDHAVPRRLARPVADQHLGGRQRGLLAVPVVHGQGPRLHLLLHLAARQPAPAALRPVHGVRLEGPHPDLAGLDRRGGHHPRRHPRGRDRAAPAPHRRGHLRRADAGHVLLRQHREGRRRSPRRPSSTPSPAATRCRRPCRPRTPAPARSAPRPTTDQEK